MNVVSRATGRLNYRRPFIMVERRTHARTNLRVPIFVLPVGASAPIQSETENVSIDGFFFYTHDFFSPGDLLKFVLFLPAAASEADSAAGVCIHGEAEITRISIGPVHAGYGIGCQLRTYRVLPDPDALALAETVTTILQPSDF
jgi:hypothetical protein